MVCIAKANKIVEIFRFFIIAYIVEKLKLTAAKLLIK